MATIYDLKRRAKELAAVTETNAVDPAKVGNLIDETLELIDEYDKNAVSLGIRKTYATVAAMEADKTSPSGSDGKKLRFGQLVSVMDAGNTTAVDNGKVFAWQNPGWKLAGNTGGNIAQELGGSQTATVSQKVVTDNAYTQTVTYNKNRGIMLLMVPRSMRKQYFTVSYVDADGSMKREIRTAPYSSSDTDSEWCRAGTWKMLVDEMDLYSFHLMEKRNLSFIPICGSANISTGAVDLANYVITYDENTKPIQNQGFVFSFGLWEPGYIEKIKSLSAIGVKLSLSVVCKIENMATVGSLYQYNKTRILSKNIPYKQRVICGGLFVEYYIDDMDIADNLYYMTFSVLSNVKLDVSKSAKIEVVSTNIYYKNAIYNNLLAGSFDKLNSEILLFDSIYGVTKNGIRVNSVDNESINIVIPKGTKIVAREIALPLHSFPYPLYQSIVNGLFLMDIECSRDDYKSLFNLLEISVATSSDVASVVTVSKSDYPSNEMGHNYYFIKCINTNNYHSSYGYNNASLVIGNTDNLIVEEDVMMNIRLKLMDINPRSSVERRFVDLSSNINRINKIIGTYEVESDNPYVGVVGCNHVLGSSLIKDGVSVEAGNSENGLSIDFEVVCDRYRRQQMLQPNYVLRFITNRFSVDDIAMEAAVLSMEDRFIQNAVVDMGDMYNGVISVKFQLHKVVSSIKSVKLRCTFTSNKTQGLTMNLYEAKIEGLSVEKTIAARLYNVDYTVKDTIVKSVGGKKFRLLVSDDGVLSAIPFLPTRMMIASHSWGLIPKNPTSGWYGNWGLAASAEHLDMVHQIETMGKKLNSTFSTFFFRFATFAFDFKNEKSWGQWDCSHLDFDSIYINSFVAGPTDGDWTNFGNILHKVVTEYVCKGKAGVKVYLANGGAPEGELQIAASKFGTSLLSVDEAENVNGTAWPWIMPKADDGTAIKKVPAGQPADKYTMNGNTLGHPGNYGFYCIAKRLVNQMFIDYGIANNDAAVLSFEQYKALPGIKEFVDRT